MRKISVVETPTHQGYEVTVNDGPTYRTYVHYTRRDAGEAAAVAMAQALASPSGYIIFAGEKVLKHIPAEMRFSEN